MERRRLDLRDWDALEAEVSRLHKGGYEKAGTWDLAQMCDHLALTLNHSLDGFREQLPWVIRRVAGPLVMRFLLWRRRLPDGIKAPNELMPPDGSEPEAVERFQQALARVRQPDAVFQPHPFFGPLTAAQWQRVHLLHSGHHLGFLVPKVSE